MYIEIGKQDSLLTQKQRKQLILDKIERAKKYFVARLELEQKQGYNLGVVNKKS